MKGIRIRSSGNFEVRAHRNRISHRLGTYKTYEEALEIYNNFISKNPIETKETHGMRYTSFYRVWQNMKDRCSNKNNKQYKDYGGRGIYVCESWINSFESFKSDMFDKYSDDLEIDRIDNDSGYSKGNCRWVTTSLNCSNKRKNKMIGTRALPSGRFFCSIKIEGIKYTIGTFDTAEKSVSEFNKIHREWYGH